MREFCQRMLKKHDNKINQRNNEVVEVQNAKVFDRNDRYELMKESTTFKVILSS